MIYLISGVPHCGKTDFGDWLRDNRGFLHVDLESIGGLPNLHRIWERDYGAFFRELQELHPRIVCTWGYPLECIGQIRSIQELGVRCWWFDGDIDEAERRWRVRTGREPAGREAEQFSHLRTRMSEFVALYGSNIVRTLGRSGFLDRSTMADQLSIPSYP